MALWGLPAAAFGGISQRRFDDADNEGDPY